MAPQEGVVQAPVSESQFPARACSGLAELEFGDPVGLLTSRLFLQGPGATRWAVPGHNIMAPAPDPGSRTVLVMEHGDARLWVTAHDLHRRRAEDMGAALRQQFPEGALGIFPTAHCPEFGADVRNQARSPEGRGGFGYFERCKRELVGLIGARAEPVDRLDVALVIRDLFDRRGTDHAFPSST